MFQRLRDKLRAEFGYLREFARGIVRGEVSPGQISNRMAQYANGIWSSFWKGRQTAVEERREATHERRVLDPAAEHCDDCIGYERDGWQPIGTLPAPGEASECGHRCRCIMEYGYEQNGQMVRI